MTTEKRTLEILTRIEDKLSQPLRKMSRNVDRFGKDGVGALTKLQRGFSSTRSVVLGLVAALAVRRVVSEFVGGISRSAEALDEIGLQADRLSVTSESLSTMAGVAELAGLEFDKLVDATKDLQLNLEQARNGATNKRDALATLGITVEDVSGRNLDLVDILKKVADGYNSTENATQAQHAANELMGESGTRLAVVFSQGSAGIEKYAEQLRRAGKVFGKRETDAARAYGRALTQLQQSAGGVFDALFLKLAPGLTRLFDSLSDTLSDSREDIAGTLGQMGTDLIYFADIGSRALNQFARFAAISFKEVRIGVELAKLAIAELTSIQAQSLPELERRVAQGVAQVAADTARTNIQKLGLEIEAIDERADRISERIGKLRSRLSGSGAISESDPVNVGGDRLNRSEEFQRTLDRLQAQSIENDLQRRLRALDLREEAEIRSAEQQARRQGASTEQTEQARLAIWARFQRERGKILNDENAKRQRREELEFEQSFLGRVQQRSISAIDSATDRFLDDAIDKTKSLSEAWDDFRETATNAILKILAKQLLLNAAQGFKGFKGGFGGFFGGSVDSQVEGLADGGVRRGISRIIPLRKYDRGGIANSPQLAVFGEAGAEAFVPLPDGRTIPVTMSGGGGAMVLNLSLNISAIDTRTGAEFILQQVPAIAAAFQQAAASRIGARQAIRRAS